MESVSHLIQMPANIQIKLVINAYHIMLHVKLVMDQAKSNLFHVVITNITYNMTNLVLNAYIRTFQTNKMYAKAKFNDWMLILRKF